MYGIGFWHLSCLVFSELSGSVVWCLTLIWGNFQSLFFSSISSIHFFSLILVFPLQVFYTFYSCPTILGYSVVLFSVFILYFSVLKVSFERTSSSEILSSTISCLLISPSEAFLISVNSVFYLYLFISHLFWVLS